MKSFNNHGRNDGDLISKKTPVADKKYVNNSMTASRLVSTYMGERMNLYVYILITERELYVYTFITSENNRSTYMWFELCDICDTRAKT